MCLYSYQQEQLCMQVPGEKPAPLFCHSLTVQQWKSHMMTAGSLQRALN